MHLTKFSPIFASLQQKCLEKFFSVTLGVHLHPVHPPAPPLATPVVVVIVAAPVCRKKVANFIDVSFCCRQRRRAKTAPTALPISRDACSGGGRTPTALIAMIFGRAVGPYSPAAAVVLRSVASHNASVDVAAIPSISACGFRRCTTSAELRSRRRRILEIRSLLGGWRGAKRCIRLSSVVRPRRHCQIMYVNQDRRLFAHGRLQ